MNSGEHIPVFRPLTLDWGAAISNAEKFGDPNQHSNFGPLVRRLEREIAQHLNVFEESVVVFSNCTDALASAIATSAEMDSAVIPGFSFVASLRAAQVATESRLRVADVDKASWIMRPGRVAKGEILVPVAPFGMNPTKILEELGAHSLVVDAAASFASFPDLSVLEPNHAVCFSLHATKVLGAGEGGFAVFGDSSWASKARAWSNFGRSEHGYQRSGTNSKMSEVQASFHLAKLEAKDLELDAWRSAQEIAREISGEHNLFVQPQGFETIHPYWIVELESERQRTLLESELSSRNIGFRRWWPVDLAVLTGSPALQISDSLAKRTLGLPLFCGMTESQGARISKALTATGL